MVTTEHTAPDGEAGKGSTRVVCGQSDAGHGDGRQPVPGAEQPAACCCGLCLQYSHSHAAGVMACASILRGCAEALLFADVQKERETERVCVYVCVRERREYVWLRL